MGYYAAGDWYRSGDRGFSGPSPQVFGRTVVGGRLIGPGYTGPRAATQGKAMPMIQKASFTGKISKYLKKAGKAGLPGGERLGKMLGGRRRRMNVLNARALRKALRRAEGFTRFARRVVKITSPKHHVHGFRFKRRKRRAA